MWMWDHILCLSGIHFLFSGRRAVSKAEETKGACEARVLEILASSKQENARLQAENARLISEKSTKVETIEINCNFWCKYDNLSIGPFGDWNCESQF
jgi:hypothetical protein